MSAITAVPQWDVPAQRRHLRAVPDLPHRVVAPVGAVADSRITRRGRLAVTTLVLGVCLMAGAAGAHGALVGGAAPVFDTVVVQSGQTLSQVAHRAYPDLPLGNAVQRVQAANDLNTAQVFTGEGLRIPR